MGFVPHMPTQMPWGMAQNLVRNKWLVWRVWTSMTTMTPAQPDVLANRNRFRLWPAVARRGCCSGCWSSFPKSFRAMLYGVWAECSVAGGVIFWWLFLSRAPGSSAWALIVLIASRVIRDIAHRSRVHCERGDGDVVPMLPSRF